jgi:predicted nucleotidyltransferase
MSDLQRASELTAILTSASLGRIRRIVLIGSRARGNAHPDSDYDLAVIVEPTTSWGPNEVAAERKRLQAVLYQQVPHLSTDVLVTTTEQYAAGRRVFGGVDWLIDNEGVELFAAPFHRKPVIRRTSAQVRNGYVATWVFHALRALEAAFGNDAGAEQACVDRALAALLVFHQIPASKLAGTDGLLALLRSRDGPFADWAQALVSNGIAATTAHAILKAAVERISKDAAAAPYVSDARTVLARPMRVPVR